MSIIYGSKFGSALVKVCYLLIKMSALPNTVCRKVRNSFSQRLNNHRKDITNSRAIKAYKHFNNWNYVFIGMENPY